MLFHRNELSHLKHTGDNFPPKMLMQVAGTLVVAQHQHCPSSERSFIQDQAQPNPAAHSLNEGLMLMITGQSHSSHILNLKTRQMVQKYLVLVAGVLVVLVGRHHQCPSSERRRRRCPSCERRRTPQSWGRPFLLRSISHPSHTL